MGPSRGVWHAAPVAGVPHGTKGQAGVRPGTAAIRAFFAWGGPRRGSGCPPVGALSFDAVKHLVLCRLEGRPPPRLDLELYPYLPQVQVSITSAGDYMTLLSGRAA